MIFLIDDNRYEQQQKLYGADYLFDGSFKEVLTTVYKLKLNEYKFILTEKLRHADAILLHNTFADADENGSYLDNSRIIRDYLVEEIMEEESIPFVLFSGGISDTKFDDEDSPTMITGINKNVFYQNLYEFLSYHKQTNQIELKILAYGKQYHIVQMLKHFEEIVIGLNIKDKDAFFEPHFVNLNAIKAFYELSKTTKSKDFIDFWAYINSRILSVNDFIKELEKIKNKAIKKYG